MYMDNVFLVVESYVKSGSESLTLTETVARRFMLPALEGAFYLNQGDEGKVEACDPKRPGWLKTTAPRRLANEKRYGRVKDNYIEVGTTRMCGDNITDNGLVATVIAFLHSLQNPFSQEQMISRAVRRGEEYPYVSAVRSYACTYFDRRSISNHSSTHQSNTAIPAKICNPTLKISRPPN